MELPTATLPLTYRVPLAGNKFSTNKIYAGTHWSKRKSVKDGLTGIAGLFCRPAFKIGSYPVEIRYRFCFASRPLDTLNCATMAKMLEDAFRAIGILEDDDPAHVAKSVLEVAVLPRPKGPPKLHAPGAKGNAPYEDYVDITINEYARNTNDPDGSEKKLEGDRRPTQRHDVLRADRA